MVKLRSLSTLDWATAGVCLTAFLLALAPAPARIAPPFDADERGGVAPMIAPSTVDAAAQKFDRTALPPAKINAPQPVRANPRAALNGYQLLGVTLSNEKSIALVSHGGNTMAVTVGDRLADFEITAVKPRRIELRKGDIEASLKLQS